MTDVHPGGAAGERLFRREALEQYQRGSVDEGHLLELEPAWTGWAYRLIFLLLGVAVALSVLLHVDRVAEGRGVVQGGRLIVSLPPAYRDELRPGLPLRFEHVTEPLTIDVVHATTIEARLPAATYIDGTQGRVRVSLGRERVLFALIPALRRWHA